MAYCSIGPLYDNDSMTMTMIHRNSPYWSGYAYCTRLLLAILILQDTIFLIFLVYFIELKLATVSYKFTINKSGSAKLKSQLITVKRCNSIVQFDW